MANVILDRDVATAAERCICSGVKADVILRTNLIVLGVDTITKMIESSSRDFVYTTGIFSLPSRVYVLFSDCLATKYRPSL